MNAFPQDIKAEGACLVAHFISYVSKLSPEMQSDLPEGQRVSLRAQDVDLDCQDIVHTEIP